MPRIRPTWRGARRSEPGFPVIKFVRVDPDSRRYEKTILAEMEPLVGKPLDLDAVGARITELYGLGYFETLDYTVVAQGEGPDQEYGLEVRARRKSWGPNYVRFGLELEIDFQGSNQYNVAAEFLQTEIDDLEAELLTNVQIGSDSKITSEFYQPLDALANWFVAPACASRRAICRSTRTTRGSPTFAIARWRATSTSAATSATGARSASATTASTARRTTTSAIRTWSIRSTTTASISSSSATTSSTTCISRAKAQTFAMQWDANRTNLGADADFDRVSVDWLAAGSRGPQHAAAMDLGRRRRWTAGSSRRTCRISIRSADFSICPGLAPQSLLGPNYAIARAIYFRKISRGGEGFFEFPAYIGASLELGNTWERRSDISYGSAHKDASVFIAIDTLLGPVYLGSGYDQTANAGYYLFLGRTF